MDYHLSWLATLLVAAVGIALGYISGLMVRKRRAAIVYAWVMAGIFIAAAMTAVICDYSWMFTNAERAAAQSVAIVAALTGIVYTMQARS